MRVIFPDSPELYVAVGLILALAVAGAYVYQYFFPPVVDKLLADPRYQNARAIYTGLLQAEDATRADRQAAFAAAADYLENEHGVPADEARRNLRLTVAGYDRERSYDLRHEAIAYEQMGAYETALAYFEGAAMWQEDHDPGDHQFLQRCIARVRGKVRPG